MPEPGARTDAEETKSSKRLKEVLTPDAGKGPPAEARRAETPSPASPPRPALDVGPAPAAGAANMVAARRIDASQLWRVIELTRALNSTFELETMLDLAVDATLQVLEAERAFIVLWDRAAGEPATGSDVEPPPKVRFQVSRNFDREEVRDPESKISRTVLHQVLRTGVPVLAEDAVLESDLQALASVGRLKLRSLLCVPLTVKGKVEGALYIDNRFRSGAFGDSERRLLEAIADQCAIAIDTSRLLLDARAAHARAEEEAAAMRDAARSQRIELSRLTAALAASATKYDYPEIIGRSPPMKRVLALLDRIMGSEIPVLVTGESGTGKELIARALHQNGPRKTGPFISENFAAIPESLGESELFGHVKGAYTGAIADRPGLFELANGGTLFLDEIGDMSLNLQKKLLRVLQEGEVRRVGGTRPIPVNVRIVAATNRDLLERVRADEFREDLYYRLNVVEVKLPPLRERAEDIPALVEHFLSRAAKDEGKTKPGISREALRHLARRPWPGNVRELENAIRRLAALAGEVISQRDVLELEGEPVRAGPGGAGGDRGALKTLAELEREHTERVLAACSWKPTEAARILGISYTTLWRKMKQFGFRPGPRAEE